MPAPRLGLCCLFRDQPIRFRTTTATAIARLSRRDRLKKLATLCRENAHALLASLEYCSRHGIGCFRINSRILPLKTHPKVGYQIEDLPGGQEIEREFQRCGDFARRHDLRTCFHPDQFVVLNSPRADVVASSLAELDYQAEVAEWVGADVINIHAGGAYGNKAPALDRFARCLARLPERVRQRLTVENDDTTFTPADLLPVCKSEGVPLVYDVHHHRCNPDGMSIEQATRRATATWIREPMFHISSPIAGWQGPTPRRHHDFIDAVDFPACWRRKKITVEVEAKAKELAVRRLLAELQCKPADVPWFVYIVRCANGSLYTGITKDINRRCKQHNAGTASRYTRGHRPVRLVYQEPQPSHSLALKRELAIKALTRQEKESLIQPNSSDRQSIRH